MNPEAKDRDSDRETFKNTTIITIFNGLSTASAYVLDMVIAAMFGLSNETDALFIAITIPRLIDSVLMIAFNLILVPIFSRVLVNQGKNYLWRITSNLGNISLGILGAIAAIGVIIAPLLIGGLGAGLDFVTREFATRLFRILTLMIVPLGMIEVAKAALNSLRSFAFPASSRFVRNGVIVVAVLIGGKRLGISSLAIGYALAVWVELIYLGVALLYRGFRYKFIVNWKEPVTIEALSNLPYPLVGATLNQGSLVIERFFASFLPPGSISALVYARRAFGAIDTVFLGSISTAFMPRLSTQFAHNRLSEAKHALVAGLKMSIYLSIPLTVGIIVLRESIVRLLFQRGLFDQETTKITASLFAIFALAIPPTAIRRLLISAHHALFDAKTPFRVSVAGFVFNIFADIGLFRLLGAAGLAMGLPLSRSFTAGLLYLKLRAAIGQLGGGILLFTVKVTLASLIMGLAVFGLQQFALDALNSQGFMATLLKTVVAIMVGVGTYFITSIFLKIKEIEQLAQLFRAKLKLKGAS